MPPPSPPTAGRNCCIREAIGLLLPERRLTHREIGSTCVTLPTVAESSSSWSDGNDGRTEFRRVFAADPSALVGARRAMRAWLAEQGIAGELSTDVILATFEAAANSVEHAYRDGPRGNVALRARVDDGVLAVEVRDEGAWRVPAATGDRGRGVGLMRSLMDTAEVEPGPRGTSVHLRRKLEVADATPSDSRSASA